VTLRGAREGHAALLAFLDVVFRLLQLVFDELQLRPLREVADREDRLEDFLQADIGAVLRVTPNCRKWS
jgi:hypothetical protein